MPPVSLQRNRFPAPLRSSSSYTRLPPPSSKPHRETPIVHSKPSAHNRIHSHTYTQRTHSLWCSVCFRMFSLCFGITHTHTSYAPVCMCVRLYISHRSPSDCINISFRNASHSRPTIQPTPKPPTPHSATRAHIRTQRRTRRTVSARLLLRLSASSHPSHRNTHTILTVNACATCARERRFHSFSKPRTLFVIFGLFLSCCCCDGYGDRDTVDGG